MWLATCAYRCCSLLLLCRCLWIWWDVRIPSFPWLPTRWECPSPIFCVGIGGLRFNYCRYKWWCGGELDVFKLTWIGVERKMKEEETISFWARCTFRTGGCWESCTVEWVVWLGIFPRILVVACWAVFGQCVFYEMVLLNVSEARSVYFFSGLFEQEHLR